MNLTITHLKTLTKAQEKSKLDSLKAKDVRFKEVTSQLQKNMKECKKLITIIDNLRKKVSAQGISISNLNGDIVSKIRECDIYKKENKTLTSQMTALNRKCVDVNECKIIEHALQLKMIKMETESIKMHKYQQTKVLKEQMNMLDHKRKLKMIEFTMKTRQTSKTKEVKRKQDTKLKKFQGGTDDMGVLHGELHQQNTMNWGCVPNPGTTSLTEVSFYLLYCVYFTM
jgi:hypothetical protein